MPGIAIQVVPVHCYRGCVGVEALGAEIPVGAVEGIQSLAAAAYVDVIDRPPVRISSGLVVPGKDDLALKGRGWNGNDPLGVEGIFARIKARSQAIGEERHRLEARAAIDAEENLLDGSIGGPDLVLVVEVDLLGLRAVDDCGHQVLVFGGVRIGVRVEDGEGRLEAMDSMSILVGKTPAIVDDASGSLVRGVPGFSTFVRRLRQAHEFPVRRNTGREVLHSEQEYISALRSGDIVDENVVDGDPPVPIGLEMPPADNDRLLPRGYIRYVEVNSSEITIGVLSAGEGFGLGTRGRHTAEYIGPGFAIVR